MDEPPALRGNRHWRIAVWSLRVGFVGLAVVLAGVIANASGSTSLILAAGVVIWLAAAAVTVLEVVRAHGELPEPRPGYWSLRFLLVRDAFRPGS